MKDLISRQDAIDAITKQTIYTADIIKSRCKARLVDENGWLGGLKDAIEAVEDVPSAQKTGKWVTPIEYCQHLYETTGERYSPAPTGLESFVYCSQCGETSWFSNKYCPHCGSRNRGEEE